jgi:hypothetical protein
VNAKRSTDRPSFAICSPAGDNAIPKDARTLDLFSYFNMIDAAGPMFSSSVMAGFECGHLGWNDHDPLVATGHMPGARIDQHYGTAVDHGMTTPRDELPWRHDPARRLAAAARAGMQVIWDLNHYDPAA